MLEQDPPDTRAEWAITRQTQAASLAEDLIRAGLLDRVPPDVPFVRYVDPDEQTQLRSKYSVEHKEQVDDCHAITSSGVRLPAEAEYRIQVMYPIHPRYRQPYTKTQIRVLYDYYANTLVPCLQREGYDVGPLPSWEFFHANFTPVAWNPYQRLSPVETRVPIDQFKALRARCPPKPPIRELFPHGGTV